MCVVEMQLDLEDAFGSGNKTRLPSRFSIDFECVSVELVISLTFVAEVPKMVVKLQVVQL